MAHLSLSDAEKAYLDKLLDALSIVFGEASNTEISYVVKCGSIGTSVVVKCKVYVADKLVLEIDKDITDYGAW